MTIIALLKRAQTSLAVECCPLFPAKGTIPCKDFSSPGFRCAYLYAVVMAERAPFFIAEKDLLSLHRMIGYGKASYHPGEYRDTLVAMSGNQHTFIAAERVPEEMHRFFDDIKAVLSNNKPPTAAGILHQRIVDIHPFQNGNGRVARLIMNAVLLHFGYWPLFVTAEWRDEYSEALEQEQVEGPDGSFVSLIMRKILENEKKNELKKGVMG